MKCSNCPKEPLILYEGELCRECYIANIAVKKPKRTTRGRGKTPQSAEEKKRKSKIYYQKNKELVKSRAVKWAKDHPVSVAKSHAKYKLKLKGSMNK